MNWRDSYNPATSPSSSNSSSTHTTPSTPAHKHNYTAVVTPATCISEGYTTYTCSCGDNYTDNYTDMARHQWVEVWELLPVYESVPVYLCNKCESDVSDLLASGGTMIDHYNTGCESLGWHVGPVLKQVETGVVENQLVGYKCSVCGVDK